MKKHFVGRIRVWEFSESYKENHGLQLTKRQEFVILQTIQLAGKLSSIVGHRYLLMLAWI